MSPSPTVVYLLGLADLRDVAIAALLLVPLERLIPEVRGQQPARSLWRTDVAYLFLNGAVIRLGMVFVLAAVFHLRPMLAVPSLAAGVAHQPLWLQAIEALLVADLAFYLTHRLFHWSPWLWRLHAVHHSIEELDWLASFRVHPLDQIVMSAAAYLPLVALGFSDWAVAAYGLVYRFHSLALHANIRLGLGRLGLLVATPEFHHWHHSKSPEARDHNFAGQIAAWDLVFGTAYLPAHQAPGDYGLDAPMPEGYVDQLVQPFRAPRTPAAPAETAPAA